METILDYNIKTDDENLKEGIAILHDYYDFSETESGCDLIAEKTEKNVISIEKKENAVTIKYYDTASFFYGFSYCLQKGQKDSFFVERTKKIKRLCLMRDCARNSALSVQGAKDLIVYAVLLGYDSLELYAEDLMTVKDLPYMGINRPTYSAADIKELDAFAKKFGVELVPSIQTLSHLPQLFTHPEFFEINDTGPILLIGEEKTYKFIETVVKWVAENFSSRKINIGFDEAHDMGKGRYADKFGYPQDKGELFLYHLSRVTEICLRYGFKPHLFSDMFFRFGLGNKTPASFEHTEGMHFPADFIKRVPRNINLVFWDYNHSDDEFYERVIAQHKELTDDLSFACGAWTWKGYVPFNTIAENNSSAALKNCVENGIKNFMVTVWGDGGGECSLYSATGTLLKISELAYGGNVSEEALNERAISLFGNSYEEFKNTENCNITRPGTIKNGIDINPSKYHLYNDALLGIMDAHAYAELDDYFKRNAEEMKKYAERGGRFSYVFDALYRLCSLLSVKATLGIKLKSAYDKADKIELNRLASRVIPQAEKLAADFYEAVRKQWKAESRSTGFEITDVRIGGLIFRLKNVARTVKEYLNGEIERIEELERNRLPFRATAKTGEDVVMNSYEYVVSGSIL